MFGLISWVEASAPCSVASGPMMLLSSGLFERPRGKTYREA